MPDPKSLGANYHGQTSIGCRIRGVKDGKERTYYIYNNCDHETAFKETGTQAVSFTTGVPAALGASMWAKGLWRGAGVFNVEEFDPDPFLAELDLRGFPGTSCSTSTSRSEELAGRLQPAEFLRAVLLWLGLGGTIRRNRIAECRLRRNPMSNVDSG